MDDNLEKNYGVIYDGKPRLSDYPLGTDNGYNRVVLKEDMDWSALEPSPESQAYVYFDDYACVTHSTLLVIAAVLQHKINTGNIIFDNITWLFDNGYLDDNGKINFNDRFTAILTKTKCGIGNYQHIVNDGVREFGLTPQSKWNYDKDDFTSCELFYADEVPEEMLELGKEFLRRFQLNYEVINPNNDLEANEGLKYSPMVTLVRAWFKNDEGLYYFPVPPEVPYKTYNHQVVKYKPKNVTDWIWDSYSDYDDTPFKKELSPNYVLGTGYIWFINELNVKENNMITYKKVGEAAVYFAVGTKLIPFATTWEDYLVDFEDAALIELTEAEFSKFTIAQAVEVKSK